MDRDDTKKRPGPDARAGILAQLSNSLHALASHLCVYANVLRHAAVQQGPR